MNESGDDLRRATNPIFNANRFKLGVFALNGTGAQLTHGPGPEVSWPRSSRIAALADASGFEAIVPYTRWKGLPPAEGSARRVPHDVFDPATWAAGIAASTRHSGVFATTAVPLVHPIVVAKQATTVDHISGGRFALNVVAGWNAAEFTMFGEPLKEHDDRYDQATEWMEILRQLWTQEEFDFEGRYYRIARGESWPKPLQQPYPAIMNAGGSNKGAHFAAKYADLCFVLGDGNLEELGERVAEYKRLAREEYGRSVQVWTTSNVVVRATHDELHEELARQRAALDPASVRQLEKLRSEQAKPLQIPGRASSTKVLTAKDAIALTGTPQQIVERIEVLAEIGLDGVLLMSQQLENELPLWNQAVMPLMVQAGLRAAHGVDGG